MVKHLWSVACRLSSIDSETNNISLISVLEQLSLSRLPKPDDKGSIILPMEYEIVSLWTKEGKSTSDLTGKTYVVLKDPNGNAILPPSTPIDIDLTNYKRMRTRSRIKGFRITSEGTYIFEVIFVPEGSDKELRAAEVPIDVALEKPKANT